MELLYTPRRVRVHISTVGVIYVVVMLNPSVLEIMP
tara:strand:+ start:555 stop:662 length:108 start_codon:yes stop_codon:yes gene_type:complete